MSWQDDHDEHTEEAYLHWQLVDACRTYLKEKRCIVWAHFVLAKNEDFDRAAEWLADQIEGVHGR